MEIAGARLAAESQCLAEAMYYEARGEGIDGQKAVAEVVLQRTRNRNYGNTVCSVVYEGIEPGRLDCQFSFACDGSRDRPKEETIWQETKLMAEKIMTGQMKLADQTGQAVSYHSVDVTPFWSASMHRTAQIGNHIFYRFAPRNAPARSVRTPPPPQNVRSKVQNISTDGARAAESRLPQAVRSLSSLRRQQDGPSGIIASSRIAEEASMIRKSVASLLLACISLALTIAIPARAQTATVFEGARLITGDGTAPIENSAFVVEGNRITAVGRRGEVRAPQGAARIDLTGKTVIPGLIDAHSHIGYMRNLTSGPQNYTRENILDHMQRFAYHGVVASMAYGSDFGELPYVLRDETAAGPASERGAVPDRGPRSRAGGRDQPEQHAPFGDPDHRAMTTSAARCRSSSRTTSRCSRPGSMTAAARSANSRRRPTARSSTKPTATTSASWSTPRALKT